MVLLVPPTSHLLPSYSLLPLFQTPLPLPYTSDSSISMSPCCTDSFVEVRGQGCEPVWLWLLLLLLLSTRQDFLILSSEDHNLIERRRAPELRLEMRRMEMCPLREFVF